MRPSYLSPSEHSAKPTVCACVFFLLDTAPLTEDSTSFTAPLTLLKTNDIFVECQNNRNNAEYFENSFGEDDVWLIGDVKLWEGFTTKRAKSSPRERERLEHVKKLQEREASAKSTCIESHSSWSSWSSWKPTRHRLTGAASAWVAKYSKGRFSVGPQRGVRRISGYQ